MVSREELTRQLDGLQNQRRQHEDDIKAIDGALQLCQFFLDRMNRDDAEKAKADGVVEAS